MRYAGFGRWLVTVTGIAAFPLADAQSAPSQTKPASMHTGVTTTHLPVFITPPGDTDVLLVAMAFVLIGAVLAAGVFFFWLHSLPERMVHKSTKFHFDIVAVLALLSLFTHIHLFWVAALLLALVKIPNFSMPDFGNLFGRMAGSLEKMASAEPQSIRPPPPEASRPRRERETATHA
jgi:hypothetical protein